MKRVPITLLLVLVALLLFTGTALAQEGQPPANIGAGILLWVLGQSATVSLAVSALKRNPWVRAHPKMTAAALNVVVSVAEVYLIGVLPGGALVTFLTAIAAQFGASGWYENVTKPGITFIMPPRE